MTIEFKAQLIREPRKAKSDEWKDTAHEWRVTINGEAFEYWMGLAFRKPIGGHYDREEYKRLINSGHRLTDYGLEKLLQVSRAEKPTLDDVLDGLIRDGSSAEEMGFEDWCDEFGHDTDSRKALEIYLDCQNIAKRLRKAGVNIGAERERLADY